MNFETGRIRTDKLLFYLAFLVYLIDTILNASLYTEIFPRTMFRLMEVGVIGICFVKWLISESYSLTKFLIWSLLLGACIAVTLSTGYYVVLVVASLVLASENIEFDNILRMIGYAIVLGMFLIIISCKVGILADYTFIHTIGSSKMLAHSLGFKYYSTLGYLAMTLSVILIYFQKNCGYIKLGGIIIVNYLFYKIHTTNLSFYITLLFIAAYLVVIKRKIITFKSRIWKVAAIIVPVILPVGTLGLVLLYSKKLIKVSHPLLNTINARFKYSVQAIDEYGIHLFGTKVQMYGNTELDYGDAKTAFYIDSGYVYSWIAYGVVFTLVIMLIYILVVNQVYRMQDDFLYLWAMMMLFACCINNFLISLLYNPILFLLASVILSERKRLRIPGQNKKFESI